MGAAPQTVHVLHQLLFYHGGIFAPLGGGESLDIRRQSGRVVVHDLRRRGDGHRLQRLGAPLGQQVKIPQRINGVAPQFQTDGIRAGGGIHVHNTTPHRKLTRTLDLGATLIARRGQRGRQVIHR